MLELLGVGFLAGLVTALSPCVLPVLPVIFAGSSTGGRRRSVTIVVGLVASFGITTLVGGIVLSALGLPEDLLRDVGIALLLLLAIGLLVDPVGQLLERPFARMARSPDPATSSGLLLGAGLGLVFVPCAGPILAAISVVAATHRVGLEAAALTASYCVGVAIPLLVFALLSQRLSASWSVLKQHARTVRRVAGALIGVTALAIAFNLTAPLQTDVPSYATSIEAHLTQNETVQGQIHSITGEHANSYAAKQSKAIAGSLPNLGPAANFTGITAWLNTPGNRPLSLSKLRGHVVLVDFWTYSCINCRRSLPHVEAWYKSYARDGFVVVGVHTPEFAFEHVVSNVKSAASSLGVRYPVAIDDNDATWNAYNNEYWPAEYLIDQNGDVRRTDFGEGQYGAMEQDIRLLLTAGGATKLPPPTDIPDLTPTTPLTPESYLGYSRLDDAVNASIADNSMTNYTVPVGFDGDSDSLAFSGRWNVHEQEATAGRSASLHLNFTADDVYIVLGGHGSVTVRYPGQPTRTLAVNGYPTLYTLVASSSLQSGVLSMSATPGVEAYDLTFG